MLYSASSVKISGDSRKLTTILSSFNNIVSNTKSKDSEDDTSRLTQWLIEWVLHNCDNDWEHSYGVHIKSTQNQTWEIKIDLGWDESLSEEIDYRKEGIVYSIDHTEGTFIAECNAELLWDTIYVFKNMLRPEFNPLPNTP